MTQQQIIELLEKRIADHKDEAMVLSASPFTKELAWKRRYLAKELRYVLQEIIK